MIGWFDVLMYYMECLGSPYSMILSKLQHSAMDMTVFTASWSGLLCAHSQLLYVCYVAFSQFILDKVGERALTASHSGHLETVKFLLHRGASINYQQKVRVLYSKARKFGGELK